MGYLDNSSITIDAILTKKGRELLARNDQSFNITHFALADDEIDYGLFNENHPNGTQYSGEAIENMNLIEAIPDENNVMKHKLITLNPGTSIIPYLSIDNANPVKSIGTNITLSPFTHNLNNSATGQSESFYLFRIADGRLVNSFVGNGGSSGGQNFGTVPTTPFSMTAQGTTLSIQTVLTNAIFGQNTGLITTITITGGDTGASMTIPFIVTVNPNDSGATAVPSNY